MLNEKELVLLKQLGISTIKICSSCNKELPLDAFEAHPRYKDGRRGQCRECRKLDHKEYYKKHAESISIRTTINKLVHPREYWAYSTLHSHKSRGCTIEINRQDLIQLAYETDSCPICGSKLEWNSIGKNGSPISNSPTLDRMNQEKVIKMNNIQIICSRCNVSKNARSMSEFKEYCTLVASLWG